MAVNSVTMGKKLRSIRKENHMTQTQFASALNISQQTLSRYETGQIIIPYEELENVIEKFGVSIEYILELDSDEVTSEEKRIIDYYRNTHDSLKPHVKAMMQKIMEEFPKDKK